VQVTDEFFVHATGRHFARAALLIQFIRAPNVNSSMSRTSKTKWMAAAFETLTTKFPQCRTRWISDDKWFEIIRNNCFAETSKEKEKELCFDRGNMVKAGSSQWSHSTEDFTTANQCGCCVQNTTVNDRGENVTKRRTAICCCATIPGKDCPRKPRVAEVFKEQDEMDDRVRGQKKR
jgi:hypothetical protein